MQWAAELERLAEAADQSGLDAIGADDGFATEVATDRLLQRFPGQLPIVVDRHFAGFVYFVSVLSEVASVKKTRVNVRELRVEPVRIPKAATVVTARLRRRIVSGDLEHGGSLPNESELMRHYEVSRPTVREALRILESESLIAVNRGANGGARVQRPDVSVTARHAALSGLRTQQTPLADVFEARCVIEPAAVGLLAANRTDEDLDVLRQSHEGLLALADDPVGFPVAAAQFHLQVVELAGNRTLALFGRIMLDIVETHNRAIFSVRPADGAQVGRANQEHAELLSHVEERNRRGRGGVLGTTPDQRNALRPRDPRRRHDHQPGRVDVLIRSGHVDLDVDGHAVGQDVEHGGTLACLLDELLELGRLVPAHLEADLDPTKAPAYLVRQPEDAEQVDVTLERRLDLRQRHSPGGCDVGQTRRQAGRQSVKDELDRRHATVTADEHRRMVGVDHVHSLV